jgi:GH24 family phage-related lysozyme (muramidase)
LGQVSATQFESDWGDLLPAGVMNLLLPYVGRSELPQSALASVSGVKIPWDAAMEEFEQRTLPQAIQDTRDAYPQLDDLPPESQAALVSLVYNRGNYLGDKPAMKRIQTDLKTGKLEDIPKQFHLMGTVGQELLRPRRLREETLFSKGLARRSSEK